MKNKVISLFGASKIAENDAIEYSKLLESFLAPFEKEFPRDWYMEDIFSFAMNSWNIGNFRSIVPESELKKNPHLNKYHDHELELANKMADYKFAKFKEYNRFIADFEITEVEGEHVLTVITQDEETFVTEMMETYSDEENYEDNYIDRHAIVLKLKQPFFDWINTLYPDDEVTEEKEASIYLVDDEIDDVEVWLRKKFDKLFTLELDGWHTNKKEWPQKRNYKMFNQWFEVTTSTMVYDMENQPVMKGI